MDKEGNKLHVGEAVEEERTELENSGRSSPNEAKLKALASSKGSEIEERNDSDKA